MGFSDPETVATILLAKLQITGESKMLWARLLAYVSGGFVSFAGGEGEHGSCAVSKTAGRPAEVLRQGSGIRGIRVDATASRRWAHDQHIY
jgi:hypothetical protein